jgi:hypothetical protein
MVLYLIVEVTRETQRDVDRLLSFTLVLGVAGVISGKFSVREMATKSPLVARHDYI